MSKPNPPNRINAPESMEYIHTLLEVTRDGFRDVGQEIREVKKATSTQESVLRELITSSAIQKEQIQRFIKLLDGNGQEGLVARLAKIEKDITNLQSNFERLTLNIKEIEDDIKEDKDKVMDKMWSLLKPLIAAALGAGAAMGTANIIT